MLMSLFAFVVAMLYVGQVPQEAMKIQTHEKPGVTTVSTFQAIIQEQLDYPWLPNDMVWRYTPLDDMPSFQIGQRRAWKVVASKLHTHLSATRSSGGDSGYLELALQNINNDPRRMFMPDYRGLLRAAISQMELYKQQLIKGERPFTPIKHNLRVLLEEFTNDMLRLENRLTNAALDTALVPSEEAEGDFIADESQLYVNLEADYMNADDLLFYAQGYAYVVHAICQALQHDYKEILVDIAGVDLMKNTLFYLEHAIYIDPPFVTNWGPNNLLANHLAKFNNPFSKAREKLVNIIENIPLKK